MQQYSYRSGKANLENVSGRKTKYTTVSGTIDVDMKWIPLTSLPPPPNKALHAAVSTQCVVTVFVYSANNLGFYTSNKGGAAVPIPVGYLPSPQVLINGYYFI